MTSRHRYLVALGVHALDVGNVIASLDGIDGHLCGAAPCHTPHEQPTARVDGGAGESGRKHVAVFQDRRGAG